MMKRSYVRFRRDFRHSENLYEAYEPCASVHTAAICMLLTWRLGMLQMAFQRHVAVVLYATITSMECLKQYVLFV